MCAGSQAIPGLLRGKLSSARRRRRDGWTASPNRASVRAVCLAGFGCLVLAGCSAGAVGPGPLAVGEGQGTECAPVAAGQVLSDGSDTLSNPSDMPATIQAVSLADPHDT